MTDRKAARPLISAYSLMLAALTVTGGRMGDLFGRKRMFMTGAVIFADDASTAALLVAKYRGHDRAMAFGI